MKVIDLWFDTNLLVSVSESFMSYDYYAIGCCFKLSTVVFFCCILSNDLPIILFCVATSSLEQYIL